MLYAFGANLRVYDPCTSELNMIITGSNGRPACNLRFADDINVMAGSNIELQDLSIKLVERAGAYGMELDGENFSVMGNSIPYVGFHSKFQTQLESSFMHVRH